MLSSLLSWLESVLGASPAVQRQLAATAAIAVAIATLRWVALRLVHKRTDDSRTFQGVSALSTYLGLLSAGLAIALQDPIVNLAGWLFILWRRPFDVGDRVQVGRIAATSSTSGFFSSASWRLAAG